MPLFITTGEKIKVDTRTGLPRPRRQLMAMSARSKARKRALDLLYASEMRNRSTATRSAEQSDAGPVNEYTDELVQGVTEHRDRLDEVISPYAEGWTLARMPAVDRNVLRLATFEMLTSTRSRRRRRLRGAATWCASCPPTSRRRSSTACSATSSATARPRG